VLRHEQGYEYYVNVYASYAISVFGTSLSELANKYNTNNTTSLGVPYEIYRLLDGIVCNGGLSNNEVRGYLKTIHLDTTITRRAEVVCLFLELFR
jgi:hypothetical protein